jgi:hypothetical protein
MIASHADGSATGADMDEIDEKLAKLPADLARRIRPRVTEEGDCLIWKGTYNGSGVTPVLWLPKPGGEGNSRPVRRAIAEQLGIKGRKSYNATARCGDLRCVCPAHVQMVSLATISMRAIEATGHTRNPVRQAKVERANRARAKLTWEMAAEIRASTRSERQLALVYGVHRSTIGRVRRGTFWANPQQEGPDWGSVFWRLAA